MAIFIDDRDFIDVRKGASLRMMKSKRVSQSRDEKTMLRHRGSSSQPPTTVESPPEPTSRSVSSPKNRGKGHRLVRWAVLLACVYLFVPVWFYACSWWRRQVIFMNNINFEPFINLSAPHLLGLPCATHFFLKGEDGVQLGAWYLPPRSLIQNGTCPDEPFQGSRPVVLYFHGAAFTRGATFRRRFYRLATGPLLDCHLLTLDYRGFGDSSNLHPSMEGVTADAEVAYLWLLSRVPLDRVLVWGHSLGSGLAIQLASKFSGVPGLDPPAMVLESPFTSMYDAVHSFPFSVLHNFLPFFDVLVATPISQGRDTYITNDDKIGNVTSALLMLHAADDVFLDVEKARLMHRLALEGRRTGPTPRYVEFEARLGYGHMGLSRDPLIPLLFNQLLKESSKDPSSGLLPGHV